MGWGGARVSVGVGGWGYMSVVGLAADQYPPDDQHNKFKL